MEAEIQRKFDQYKSVPLSWDPEKGGKAAFVCFRDSKTVSLGADPSGQRFDIISERMLNGQYYPADAVQFFGRHQDEHRPMRKGDHILQRAPLFGLSIWSMVEIYVAEKQDNVCQIGYVTTVRHHGRGIWTATLIRENDELKLTVESVASPNTWLFWLGLPVARFLQLRARRRGIENLRSL